MQHRFASVPDDEELYELFNYGLSLFTSKHAFEAHEFWEYAWKAECGRTKLFLQALIQIAAAIHKHEVGVPAGTCKLLAKAHDRVLEIKTGCQAWMGIDLIALEKQVIAALRQADQLFNGHEVELEFPKLPESIGPDRIIYLHGFASSPRSKKAGIIVDALKKDGYEVCVPDFNFGGFSELSISRSITQVKRLLCDRNLLIGSSLGGYIASLVASQDDRVKALVLMAPAFDFPRQMHLRHGDSAIAEWKTKGSMPVEHYGSGQLEMLNFNFFDDAQKHPAFAKLRVPTYVLHGEQDDTVSIQRSVEARSQNEAFMEIQSVDDGHSLINSVQLALSAARRFAQGLKLRPQAQVQCAAEALKLLENDPRFAG